MAMLGRVTQHFVLLANFDLKNIVSNYTKDFSWEKMAQILKKENSKYRQISTITSSR